MKIQDGNVALLTGQRALRSFQIGNLSAEIRKKWLLLLINVNDIINLGQKL